MRRSDGMTLIEVMVAIVIIAVGILAAASLQTTSLRASSNARLSIQLTELAQNELDVKRKTVYTDEESIHPDCSTTMPGSYSCKVTVAPCTSTSLGTLNCANSLITTTPAGHYATVTVRDPQQTEFSLSAVLPYAGD